MSPALAVPSIFWLLVPVLGVPFFVVWAVVGIRFKVRHYWLYLAASVPTFVLLVGVLLLVMAFAAYMGDTSKPELFHKP
jgi:membrane protein CcdC involved in cytochrome C biogenesis